ncbi:MAG: hypothetical protein JSU79_10670 [Dehalococcoidales bacterium]|nr:MAG: hypothetical protein JSU79_10670 [Dehalococcoidales bacterium]
MAVNIGDKIIYVNEENDRECIKGEIVDIWRNHSGDITDYFVALDSGLYTNIKPHYPNWFKLDNRIFWFENNHLSLNVLESKNKLLVNA